MHFDVLKDKIKGVSAEYLYYCWRQGVAAQMVHPQHGIDGIIPVFVVVRVVRCKTCIAEIKNYIGPNSPALRWRFILATQTFACLRQSDLKGLPLNPIGSLRTKTEAQ